MSANIAKIAKVTRIFHDQNDRTIFSCFINWYIINLLLIGVKSKRKHKKYLKDTINMDSIAPDMMYLSHIVII